MGVLQVTVFLKYNMYFKILKAVFMFGFYFADRLKEHKLHFVLFVVLFIEFHLKLLLDIFVILTYLHLNEHD